LLLLWEPSCALKGLQTNQAVFQHFGTLSADWVLKPHCRPAEVVIDPLSADYDAPGPSFSTGGLGVAEMLKPRSLHQMRRRASQRTLATGTGMWGMRRRLNRAHLLTEFAGRRPMAVPTRAEWPGGRGSAH
jgi:hypothetical protein